MTLESKLLGKYAAVYASKPAIFAGELDRFVRLMLLIHAGYPSLERLAQQDGI